MKMPEAVRRAFMHLNEIGIPVVNVVFFPDGRWLYFDADNESPAFDGRADVSILEAALDEVGDAYYELPVSFGIPYEVDA